MANKAITPLRIPILLLLLLSSSSVCFASSGIFFSGISTDAESYISGSEVRVETTLMNREQSSNVNMTVRYKILRETDAAIILSDSDQLSMAASEVRLLNKTLTLPKKSLSGAYLVSVEAIGSSGTPFSSTIQEISINGSSEGALFSEKGVYLKVSSTEALAEGVTRTITKYIYGSVGDTITRGNPISAQFTLRNQGQLAISNISARMKAIPSYEQSAYAEKQSLLEVPLGSLAPGEKKEYSIDLSINKPGTYAVILSIYSGEDFLGSKEVRAVISGEDGTILNIKNTKDTYTAGEDFHCTVSYVGPADKSVVEGAYIQLTVLSQGNAIRTLRKDGIRLSTEPASSDFSFIVSQELKKYDLEIELGKGDEVFDKAISTYEYLQPNSTVTSDGRTLPKGEGCFDDNLCTVDESKIGDCIDCAPLKKTIEQTDSEANAWLIGAAVIIILIILVLFIMVKFKR
jgi:hypothetical protein